MPTFANSDLPPPTSWEEFETIVVDLVQEEWHDPGSTKYGRTGQAQQGVDVYCKPPRLDDEYCGFQCKRTNTLNIDAVRDEIKKAENFRPSLGEFVVMTTAPEDNKLQEEVRKLSAERVDQDKFPVRIQMWDKISQSIANHPNLIETHYPQFIDWSDQLESQGFFRLSPRYFQRSPPEEPAVCWRTGFELNEVREYSIDRSYLTEDGTRESVIEHISHLSRHGKNNVVTGPPGSGKSTICRAVACSWYDKKLGTVFYRKGTQIESLNKPSLVAKRIRNAVGDVLIVVENAAGEHTEATHQLINQFRNDSTVSFLLEARQSDWNSRDESLTQPRLKDLGEAHISTYVVPVLDYGECKRIVEKFKSTTNARNVPSSEILYRDIAKFDQKHAQGNSTDIVDNIQSGAEVCYLSHRLSLYAFSLKGTKPVNNTITSLKSDAQNVYNVTSSETGNEMARPLGFIINLLNLCKITVNRELLHSIAENDNQHEDLERALQTFDGKLLFLEKGSNNIRINHPCWSLLYVRSMVQSESEYELQRQFEKCLNTMIETLTNTDSKDDLRRFSENRESIFQSINGREFVCNVLLPSAFELGMRYPVLAPLFGTSINAQLHIPDHCTPDLAIAIALCRGRTNHSAGDHQLAIDELTTAP